MVARKTLTTAQFEKITQIFYLNKQGHGLSPNFGKCPLTPIAEASRKWKNKG